MTSWVPHTLHSLLFRSVRAALAALVLCVIAHTTVLAQDAQTAAQAVPRVITLTGVFQPVDGQPARAVETVTLAIYAEPTGGTPLWQETQSIALDVRGRYVLLLGATSPEGIPAAVLATGPQWLGTKFDRPGEVEGARVQLTSVPYTLRAADADTLGGRPASAYLLAPTAESAGSAESSASAMNPASESRGASTPATPQAVLPGTDSFIAKYVGTADVGPSTIYQSAGSGNVGIGTTNPLDSLHVAFTNPGGSATGLAVQNLSGAANAYSGMLFYDQNGVLGQFQGFNNTTHEYRINNVAKNVSSQYNGSINFMLGGVSKFLVASNGNIGIGTTSPSALLEVSNALSVGVPSNMWVTSYTNFLGPYYLARRARGTAGTPTAVQNGDGLSGLYGMGYGATQFGPAFTGGITIQAAQNFTDSQQGTAITFSTTAINATTPTTRMTLDASGNLGIGTATVPASGILEVSNATTALGFAQITGSSFTGVNGAGTLFVGRKARGTSAAPTAVQGGDNLAAFLASGYGATGFSGTRGGMFVRAAEPWTDAFQGTSLAFNTTPIGTNTPGTRVTINPSGDVGVGTTNPQGAIEIMRNGEANLVSRSFNNDDGSAVYFQRARGTSAAPSAVQAGDVMGYFGAGGYGATGFGDGAGAMAIVAAENWTDTANGTTIAFASTSMNTTDFVPRMVILPNGFVGIGTPDDANGIPTATDRLQVFGDVRVGASGTDGCVKNFAGTQLVGTCVSDRRFKKNITPFGPVLNRFAALQPVYYNWRASEFPERHFGEAQTYGLVAQDVEQVLPDLVVTGADGFKAIDYSKLPMLTIEAVKELKNENDELKRRLAEVERLLAGMLAGTSQR